MPYLASPECTIEIAAWGAPFLGSPSSPAPPTIFYFGFEDDENTPVDGAESFPDLAAGPAWYWWERPAPPKRIIGPVREKYRSPEPVTAGFFCAFGGISARVDGQKDDRGEFTVSLEAVFRFRKPAPALGKKVREIAAEDAFSDSPFEVLLLPQADRKRFFDRAPDWFHGFGKGLLALQPVYGLRFSALLDCRRLFQRDLPYRPLKGLADVEMLLYEQCRTLLRADPAWLNPYWNPGNNLDHILRAKRQAA